MSEEKGLFGFSKIKYAQTVQEEAKKVKMMRREERMRSNKEKGEEGKE